MERQVYCPHCDRIVTVSADQSGAAIHCPHCQGLFRVPPGLHAGEPSFNPYRHGARPDGAGIAAGEPLRDAVGIARIACGLLAIFGAWAGLHKFAMGRIVPGLIMLLVTLMSCFILAPIIWIIGIIEGVTYLVQDDGEFLQRYVVEKRGWF